MSDHPKPVGPACTDGKISFRSKAEAKIAMRDMHPCAKDRLRPFHCPLCGFWHIGHQPKGVSRDSLRRSRVQRFG